jgi:hypothetical protein
MLNNCLVKGNQVYGGSWIWKYLRTVRNWRRAIDEQGLPELVRLKLLCLIHIRSTVSKITQIIWVRATMGTSRLNDLLGPVTSFWNINPTIPPGPDLLQCVMYREVHTHNAVTLNGIVYTIQCFPNNSWPVSLQSNAIARESLGLAGSFLSLTGTASPFFNFAAAFARTSW